MSLDCSDIVKLKLRLLRLAEAPQVANEVMKECAEELAEKARDMAPIDYGDLKGAIQVARRGAQGAGGRFVKGVSNYEIFINDRHPVSDPDKLKHGVTHVGQYAWYVHTHMHSSAYPNPKFMPSEASIRAGQEKGVEAGGQFLERAALMMMPALHAKLTTAIFKYMKVLDSE